MQNYLTMNRAFINKMELPFRNKIKENICKSRLFLIPFHMQYVPIKQHQKILWPDWFNGKTRRRRTHIFINTLFESRKQNHKIVAGNWINELMLHMVKLSIYSFINDIQSNFGRMRLFSTTTLIYNSNNFTRKRNEWKFWCGFDWEFVSCDVMTNKIE